MSTTDKAAQIAAARALLAEDAAEQRDAVIASATATLAAVAAFKAAALPLVDQLTAASDALRAALPQGDQLPTSFDALVVHVRNLSWLEQMADQIAAQATQAKDKAEREAAAADRG